MSEARPGIGLQGIDHVQLAMPPGGEAAARAFYGRILGLRELAKPPELAGRGGCWFAGAGVTIHLGVEDPFVPARKAHPGLLVADLETAIATLRGAGVAIVEDASGLPVARCYTTDPFGNRIELIDRRDQGFSERAR